MCVFCVTFVLGQHKIDISSMFWFCLESGHVDSVFSLVAGLQCISSQMFMLKS